MHDGGGGVIIKVVVGEFCGESKEIPLSIRKHTTIAIIHVTNAYVLHRGGSGGEANTDREFHIIFQPMNV